MEYVNILSIIIDSDSSTTKEFSSLFDNVPTQFFADSDMLSDTPIINKTDDGRFVAVSKEDGYVVLEYFVGGKGSFKSCTKKFRIEFVKNLANKLLLLQPDKPTNFEDDIAHQQLCMAVNVYDLKRDSVDFNQIIETKKYEVCYYLRKNKKDWYILQSELRLQNTKTGDYAIHEFLTYNEIAPLWQKMLLEKTNSPYMENFKQRFPWEASTDFDDDEFDDELDDEFDDEFDENFEDDEFDTDNNFGL